MLKDMLILIGFAVAIIAITALGTFMADKNPATQTPLVLAQPKQTPHVIYVTVCGVLEGILVTTDPLMWADVNTPSTPELEALEAAAIAAGRAIIFSAGSDVLCTQPELGIES